MTSLGRFRCQDSLGVRRVGDMTAPYVPVESIPIHSEAEHEPPDSLSPREIEAWNRRYWEPSKQASDELETRMREREFDKGNAEYVLSTSPGEFEAEDLGDNTMKLWRVRGEGDKELVATLPGGNYRIEQDDVAAHLFRLPDGENETVPLADQPVRIGSQADAHHSAALARMNARNRARNAASGDASRDVTMHSLHYDMTGSVGVAEARRGLRALSARHKQFWGQ